MPFIFPDLIRKDARISELDEMSLEYWHDNMHVFWSKIESGTQIPSWNFEEIYQVHSEVIEQMKKKGMPHIMPINNLDLVKLDLVNKSKEESLQTEELKVESFQFSVEKKMNGFHATVHKSGDEIKIFSEQEKDLTSAFPSLIEAVKKLSSSDFIIDGELVPYDNKGNTLGRNELMKYIGSLRRQEK